MDKKPRLGLDPLEWIRGSLLAGVRSLVAGQQGN
jgi:hypothetical protein